MALEYHGTYHQSPSACLRYHQLTQTLLECAEQCSHVAMWQNIEKRNGKYINFGMTMGHHLVWMTVLEVSLGITFRSNVEHQSHHILLRS